MSEPLKRLRQWAQGSIDLDVFYCAGNEAFAKDVDALINEFLALHKDARLQWKAHVELQDAVRLVADQRNALEKELATYKIGPSTKELAANIRRNLKHMAKDIVDGNDDESRMLDYINHMDTQAQQIEDGNNG